MRQILLALMAVALLACQQLSVAAVIADDPAASPEHIYLASLEDYRIIIGDVNSYIALPSTSRAEAVRIDEIIDRADAEVARFEADRRAGTVQLDRYSVASRTLSVAMDEVCRNVRNVELVAICAARLAVAR